MRLSTFRRRAFRLAAVVGLSAALAAISASTAGTATSGRVVSLSLVEWQLLPAKATVPAGRVTFVVHNEGTMVHELVVLRSDLHHHRLKVTGGRAVETGRVGEIASIPVGASKRLSLKLRPGRYVLICNILGHYQAGQFAALRAR